MIRIQCKHIKMFFSKYLLLFLLHKFWESSYHRSPKIKKKMICVTQLVSYFMLHFIFKLQHLLYCIILCLNTMLLLNISTAWICDCSLLTVEHSWTLCNIPQQSILFIFVIIKSSSLIWLEVLEIKYCDFFISDFVFCKNQY